MNEEIIACMVHPYVQDNEITYEMFEKIFSILSLQEQYEVIEILFKKGINLVDEQIEKEALILDIEDPEIEVLYNETIFKDKEKKESGFENLVVNYKIKQSNEILCSLIQQGNRQAVQDLCVKNKRLVDRYVIAYERRYGNRLDFEDLEQVGFLGLIKAAKKFDAQKENAFSTYAVFWIKQSISREIMDNGYVIRIPVHMMERINKVVTFENQLEGTGIAVSERISVIANEMGLTEENVRECLTLKKNYLSYSSLEMPIGDDAETQLIEFIADDETPSVEAIIMGKALRKELADIIESLTEREGKIIKLRFGWEDGRARTLEEIGQQFGVTKERIRQIEAKALRKLRHPLRSRRIRAFLEE